MYASPPPPATSTRSPGMGWRRQAAARRTALPSDRRTLSPSASVTVAITSVTAVFGAAIRAVATVRTGLAVPSRSALGKESDMPASASRCFASTAGGHLGHDVP